MINPPGNTPILGALRRSISGTKVDDVNTKRDEERCVGNRSRYEVYYLTTICKYRVLEKVTDNDIEKVLVYLSSKGVEIIEGCTESHGKYRQLHYHGIFKYKRNYSGLTKFNKFRIFWKRFPFEDMEKVQSYIYKSLNRYLIT